MTPNSLFPGKRTTKLKGKGAIAAALALALVTGFLFHHGILSFQNPWPGRYPVRGVDVSHYQGEIDWPAIAGQGIDFAFVKATEGSSWRDPFFAANLDGAKAAGLRTGAYHFFSFDSAPETQAENFIAAVPETDLPPAVDLEFYGSYDRAPPDAETVRENLAALLAVLTKHYGQRPIVYTTMRCYRLYLRGWDGEFDLWIRDVLRQPALAEGETWVFWQYSSKGRLEGFSGEEPFIDLNVFNGGGEEFWRYGCAVQLETLCQMKNGRIYQRSRRL